MAPTSLQFMNFYFPRLNSTLFVGGRKGKVIKRADGTKIVVVDGKIVKKIPSSDAETISPSHSLDVRDVSPDPMAYDMSIKDCPFIVRTNHRFRRKCSLCNVPLNSRKQIIEHLQGKKHLAVAEDYDMNPWPLNNDMRTHSWRDDDYHDEPEQISRPIQRTIYQSQSDSRQ